MPKTQKQLAREVATLLITDKHIRALRNEAASMGDHAQALLCDLALGAVVLDEDTRADAG